MFVYWQFLVIGIICFCARYSNGKKLSRKSSAKDSFLAYMQDIYPEELTKRIFHSEIQYSFKSLQDSDSYEKLTKEQTDLLFDDLLKLDEIQNDLKRYINFHQISLIIGIACLVIFILPIISAL